ncbi:MAG TPA: fibronectin type III domain-containing protein [Solirubrobacteraceae bacterium]|nr:fibronectin type III domain-containing protein [Solirubrobacteraceae bacterium]
MSRHANSSKVRDVLQHESRLKRGIAAGIVLCLSGAIAAGTFVASAAVPAAPNNILVFPNRDFVTVEGFADHAGEQALLEITRGNTVIGSAKATVSGGDVAFEVNHPGGACWGAGTSLQVTPDIQPGDKATLSFGGKAAGDTTVQNAFVEHLAYDGAQTVTVTGIAQLGAGVDPGNIEQRIVNPDLVPLIGKRDIRAVPGGVVASPKTGPAGGYTSNLEVDANGYFTATYVFDTASVAELVATGGGERFLSWQVTDADANRQGVTIAELGEPGGPGMGGCPAGPNDTNPPVGSASWTQTAGSMQVDWNAVKAPPTAPAVTGYSIEVVDISSATQQDQVGRRVGAGARSTTITGLDPNATYDVEVRAMAGSRMGEPFHDGAVDTTPPTLTATPAEGTEASPAPTDSVTLSSDDGAIYYTIGNAPAIDGDGPSGDAVPYKEPIAITTTTEIHAAAFDDAGNHSQLDGFYAPPGAADPPPPEPPAAATPPAPTDLVTKAGFHEVALTWTGDASASSYVVRVYDAAAATGMPLVTQYPTDTKATIANLAAAKDYWFTVTAKNTAGESDPPTKAGPVKPTDAVTVATAKWKAGDFRITGTGTDALTPAATVSVWNAATDQQIGTTTVTMAPAAAPATGTTFDLRLRNGAAPASNPGRIYVKSSAGGKSAPFNVTG